MVALGGGTGLSAVLRGLKDYVGGPARTKYSIADLRSHRNRHRHRRWRKLRPSAARIQSASSRRHSQLHGCAVERRRPARTSISISISRRARAWRAQLWQSFSHCAHQRHRRFSRKPSGFPRRCWRFAGGFFPPRRRTSRSKPNSRRTALWRARRRFRARSAGSASAAGAPPCAAAA